MKLVKDLKDIDAPPDVVSEIIVVLTGDGKTERERILSPLCEKYNGKGKFLWFPKEPLGKGKKDTGLEALNPIRVYIITYKATKFLFLIDREHFRQHQVEEGQEQDKIRQVLESKK